MQLGHVLYRILIRMMLTGACLLLVAWPLYSAEVVRVGVYQNPPLIDFDDRGRVQGLFADLLRKIAENEGWSLDFVPGSWDEGLANLSAEKIDILVSMAHTPQREREFLFSTETVFSNWGQIYAPAENTLESILDLQGKEVAVLKGDVHYAQPNGLKDLAVKFSLNVKFLEYPDYSSVLNALRTGSADAALGSRITHAGLKPDDQVVKTPVVLNPVSVRYAFSQTGGDRFKEAVDRQLITWKDDPGSYYYQRVEAWLGGGVPSSIPRWVWPGIEILGLLLLLQLSAAVISRYQVKKGLRDISAKNAQLESEIAERRRVEQELARERTLFGAALNSVPDGLILCNPDREIVRCNPGVTRIFGYAPEELQGRKTVVLYASEEEHERQGRLRFNRGAEENLQPYVVSYARKDGSRFSGETLGTVIKSPAGEVLGYLGAIRDITVRRQAEEALQRELDINRSIAELSRLLLSPSTAEEISLAILEKAKILTGSRHGFVGHVDPVSGHLVCPTMSHEVWEGEPLPAKDVVFSSFSGLWGVVLRERRPLLSNQPQQHPHSSGVPEGHVPIRRFLGVPAVDEDACLGVLILANAETEYQEKDQELLERLAAIYALALKNKWSAEAISQNEDRFKHLAHHDSLTQLPNRLLFNDRLYHAMSKARRSGRQAALLFFDLDRFKIINDSLGHEIGDQVLKAVAQRLQGLVRASDTVARFGGDEFVILLEEVQDAASVATFANKVLVALAAPLEVKGHELFVTTSIGISLFPNDGEDGEALIKSADVAMFRAKEKGRNLFQFYTADMNARTHQLLMLENDLRRALEHEQLKLHFQPQIDFVTGNVIGMEALVRWHHPEKGLVLPEEFLPLAEETGLIVPIGEWVLHQACEQGCRWLQDGRQAVRMAVNISARQLRQPGFLSMVEWILEETGFDARWLELEITESALMENVKEMQPLLTALDQRGIRLAIDDFGTGYASLSYLSKFPIRNLKIDRSFLTDVTGSRWPNP